MCVRGADKAPLRSVGNARHGTVPACVDGSRQFFGECGGQRRRARSDLRRDPVCAVGQLHRPHTFTAATRNLAKGAEIRSPSPVPTSIACRPALRSSRCARRRRVPLSRCDRYVQRRCGGTRPSSCSARMRGIARSSSRRQAQERGWAERRSMVSVAPRHPLLPRGRRAWSARIVRPRIQKRPGFARAAALRCTGVCL
jgi:hypothetical protein